MRGLILAAGRGSRMGGATADRPKCLVELMGRPLLELQCAALRAAGITDIGLVRGYRGDVFEGRGLTLFDNPRWSETNMVGSLACAAAWLREAPCIISYSDIFYAPETVARLVADPHDLAVSYDPNWLDLWSQRFLDPLSDAETFRHDAQSRLIEIGNRAANVTQIEGQYMGLLKFTPAAWESIERFLEGLTPAARDKLDMTGMLSRLLAIDTAIYTVPAVGQWGEVDNESDLALYELLIKNGRLALP